MCAAPARVRRVTHRPGVELRANQKSISHRCHFFEVAFVWELTKGTIHLPLGCLQGGSKSQLAKSRCERLRPALRFERFQAHGFRQTTQQATRGLLVAVWWHSHQELVRISVGTILCPFWIACRRRMGDPRVGYSQSPSVARCVEKNRGAWWEGWSANLAGTAAHST